MAYWLFKSEPDEFGIDDLAALGKTPEPWDGIRNYQARNILRDQVADGDEVLIQDSFTKLNARIELASLDGVWSVALLGRNLTDEDGWAHGLNVSGLWAYASARAPRTWGVEVVYDFGQ